MSEQPLINYEPAPTPFTDETDVALHAGRDDLKPYEEAAALTRATEMAEKIKTPEELLPHEKIALNTQNTMRFRNEYDLAA